MKKALERTHIKLHQLETNITTNEGWAIGIFAAIGGFLLGILLS